MKVSENDIKIFIVGECGVGKTSLTKVYLGKEFDSGEPAHILPYISKLKIITTKNKSFNIIFCDIPGQTCMRYKNLTYYKGSDIVILTYCINDRESFKQLKEYWVQSIINEIGNDVIFGLAATKCDLFLNEEVSEEDGLKYANEIGATFKVTSAKDNKEGIIFFINKLIEKILLKKKNTKWRKNII